VDAGLAPVSQWKVAMERVENADSIPTEEVRCTDPADLKREVVKTVKKMQPVQSRWARVHDIFWLRMWLEPAALLGGPTHAEDVMDFVFRMPLQQG
jgi:hypothetical protein